MTEALLPSAVSVITSGAILLAAANPLAGGFAWIDAVPGCAETLPSASNTIVMPAKQREIPSRRRTLAKAVLTADFFFIVRSWITEFRGWF
jgi:hypothetical protein